MGTTINFFSSGDLIIDVISTLVGIFFFIFSIATIKQHGDSFRSYHKWISTGIFLITFGFLIGVIHSFAPANYTESIHHFLILVGAVVVMMARIDLPNEK